MANIFNRAALVALVFSGHATLLAMKAESFNVMVKNNYGAQIEVEYAAGGKTFKKVVNLDRILPLGLSDQLHGSITINRVGAIKGRVTASYKIDVNGLGQVWGQKKKPGADTLLVKVKSTSLHQFNVAYAPGIKSKLEMRENVEKLAPGDALDEFPGLKKYGLEKTLTPDQILAIRAPNEVVIAGGWIARATTGEDIARYILELPLGYNQDSVKKAYMALSLKWHPDKQPAHLQGLKDFAQKVMPVITHARDLLTEALRERGAK